jgi:hypothetical protein
MLRLYHKWYCGHKKIGPGMLRALESCKFVTGLIPCYTCRNLDTSEPSYLKRVHGLLVEIARFLAIEGVDGNVCTPQLWKGEANGTAGVLRWKPPVFYY